MKFLWERFIIVCLFCQFMVTSVALVLTYTALNCIHYMCIRVADGQSFCSLRIIQGNFFVTQDPSGTASGVSFDVPEQQLPKWETYSHTSPNTLVRFTNSNTPLGGGVTTVTTLKKSECSVLNTMMKEKMRMDYPQSYPEQDEGGDGPNDHHSSSFLKVIEKMAVLVGVAGGCVLVFVVYWGYQTLYGVSHHEAQRFLALDASADLEAAAARRAHY